MQWRALVLAGSLLWGASQGLASANQNLSAQQAQAKKERAALQQRINTLQKHIESTEADKKDISTQLRDVESRISATDNTLQKLLERQQAAQTEMASLNTQISAQQKSQEQGQQQLAEQLRAQYASGLSPWTALFSGNDPQQIQRELGYLAYVSKAQTDQVRALQQGLKRLEQLHRTQQAKQKELSQLSTEAKNKKAQLHTEQAERQTVLAKIETELQTQRKQTKTLVSNDARLGSLITGLEKEIAHQAELKRKAEEARRKAEEARKQAEARRLAAEQQRLEAEREAEAKRLHALAHTPAQPAVEPSGGFVGLKKGMAPPVRGEIQGRFGSQRPEGGPWRGIILRAAAGTPVQAIADGNVVFANWMTGFGNLLIIDHGAGYLSVYGHNQSVLKQVGDVVRAGDAVARVGATGGQVEPGVYFEIRQNGQPVNPQFWLAN